MTVSDQCTATVFDNAKSAVQTSGALLCLAGLPKSLLSVLYGCHAAYCSTDKHKTRTVVYCDNMVNNLQARSTDDAVDYASTWMRA